MASLGVILRPDNSFCVIHDGTHGAGVNGCIAVRDQLAVPTAGDLRQAVKELERPSFVLTTDVSRAHRLVKIRERDWGYQACKSSSLGSWEVCRGLCVISVERRLCSSSHMWMICCGSLEGVPYSERGKSSGFACLVMPWFAFLLEGVPWWCVC